MMISRDEFHSSFSCGCYENMFTSKTCDKHQQSWKYYLQSLEGKPVCHVWQYYQRIASVQQNDEVVN